MKAERILDLYARQWEGRPLAADEFVLSLDEKTSIQARLRRHPSTPPGPGRAMRVEHEYERGGAWAYLAALDVHRAKLFGRCELTTGIDPFHRLLTQVVGAGLKLVHLGGGPLVHSRRSGAPRWLVHGGR